METQTLAHLMAGIIRDQFAEMSDDRYYDRYSYQQ
jgi:hypothetical protein